MERKLIRTEDGSDSLYIPEWNEGYHSRYGAVVEAYHVFIRNGLDAVVGSGTKKIKLLEMGFGTGLNAFITLIEASRLRIPVEYISVEAFPLEEDIWSRLNYPDLVDRGCYARYFPALHRAVWNQKQEISEYFVLEKINSSFEQAKIGDGFDLVYFDAFAPDVQPELWTNAVFDKIYAAINPGGILVTYCAKGSVRRAMESVGFVVERLPGPPHKREMLRSIKK